MLEQLEQSGHPMPLNALNLGLGVTYMADQNNKGLFSKKKNPMDSFSCAEFDFHQVYTPQTKSTSEEAWPQI